MPNDNDEILTTEELFGDDDSEIMSTRDLFAGENQTVRAKTPQVESALRGAAQGVTMGLADEATGLAEAGGRALFGSDKIRDLLGNYRKYRDESRQNYGYAKEDNPKTYMGSEIGGGIATGFIPGMGLAKGAGLGGKLAHAAKMGGLAGFGTSTSDLSKGDIKGAAVDTSLGAGLGMGVQGLMSGAGAILENIDPRKAAKKLANVFLNTPEQITEKYMKNPAAVKGAERIYEVGTDFGENALEELKKLTTEGSAASRAILSKEGARIPRAKVAEIYQDAADKILKQSEGIISDPQKLAAYNSFKASAEQFAPTGNVDDFISTNRLKDELQSIDRLTDYGIGSGAFGRVDDTLKKGVRRTLNEELGKTSPAYKAMMPEVAADAKLLEEAKGLAKSPAGFTNLFKRLARDEYGTGQIPKETLRKIDLRLGTDYVQRAENAMVKEAFDKSITNGSMNVNKFAAMLRDVPGLKYIAPLVGATVDKYGRKMTMSAVDSAIKLDNFLQGKGPQEIVKALAPLREAARNGDMAAGLTVMFLDENKPSRARESN